MIPSFFEGATPRHLGWQRRVVVIGLGVVLATVACGIVGIAFVQSTPWYSYGTDAAQEKLRASTVIKGPLVVAVVRQLAVSGDGIR